MSSIREVARVAGVSIATVSRALSTPDKVSDAALAKVKAAIAQVDYRPNMMARNFRAARAYAILVLVPNIANPFFATVIRGIEDAAQQAGYAVLLGDTRDSIERERDYIKLVETRQSDGVLQLRPYIPGASVEPARQIPMVYACGCTNTPFPSVRIDNTAAAQAVVEYLIGQGHRTIGAIAGKSDNPHTVDRLRGFKLALEQAGLNYDPSHVINGDFTLPSGVQAARQFAAMQNKPSALFCMNDEMAIGAIQGLRAAGLRVPEDIAITGFDDIEFARYADPALTTIAQPAEALGKTAFRTLLALIEGQPPSQQEIVLPYEFIVRKSTPNRR